VYITRIKLVNWKNFRKAECKLSPRTFITGANAAGKSNLLDAIRFLRDIARKKGGGLQEAVSIRGGVSKIRSLAARQNPLVEIEVGIGDADSPEQYVYSIGIRQENKGKRRVMLAYERVTRGSDGKMLLSRPTAEDRRDDEQLTLTYLESPTTNRRFRLLADVFGSVSYLHLVPQLLRSVQSAENEQPGEDYYGRNFLVRLTSTPERTRKARLRRILEALSTAVPQFDDLKDDKDKAGVPHLLLKLKHWRPDAGWQDESQFSDGTIRMIGLFWSMLEGDTILLFEEPELSLNDKIVEQLPALLWKLQVSSGRQAILSTHSNALLSDMSITPSEVALLESGAEGTTVQIAADMPEIVAMYDNGMSIGDAILPRTAPASVTELTL
jgi:predicted ATPase